MCEQEAGLKLTQDLPNKKTALLIGGAGGIGAQVLDQLVSDPGIYQVFATHHAAVCSLHPKLEWLVLDLTDESSIAACAERLIERVATLELVIGASGLLQGGGVAPEKSMAQVRSQGLLTAYAINAAGPISLVSRCGKALRRAQAPKVCFLSAQVGSIQDNRLGGWYGYRMAKAALNMGVKNLAIEMQRWRNQACVTAIHPGTTLTELSKPFVRGRQPPPQSVQAAAQQLLALVNGLDAESSGRFLHANGTELPW